MSLLVYTYLKKKDILKKKLRAIRNVNHAFILICCLFWLFTQSRDYFSKNCTEGKVLIISKRHMVEYILVKLSRIS